MTAADLHYMFRVYMDKSETTNSYGGCPAFLPEEVDLFLNQALLEVIHNKFTGNTKLGQPFEGSVKRVADLEGLVSSEMNCRFEHSTDSTTTNEYVLNNFKQGTKEGNQRMFFVSCNLRFDYVNSAGKSTNSMAYCVLTSHERAEKFKVTHSNMPWIDTPIIVFHDNKLIVYVDPIKMLPNKEGVFFGDIAYVKYPKKIVNTDSAQIEDIPDHVLTEVVNRAVTIALENIESDRLQSKNALIQNVD